MIERHVEASAIPEWQLFGERDASVFVEEADHGECAVLRIAIAEDVVLVLQSRWRAAELQAVAA